MNWQNFAEEAIMRYIRDAEVRQLVLAEVRGAQRSADLRPRPDHIAFQAVGESRPGPKLRALFERGWPEYRRWYLQDGAAARPSFEEARAALERHMPELLPTWSALVAAVGADELGARMLTLYDPPALVSGCSQAALGGGAALVRNYDYDPNLFDAVVMETRFTDTGVIGIADQLWGLLDGVNDRGLAVSFAFGGRRCFGRGFGIPIVIRYILETCTTIEEGIAALERIPVQGAYNVTLVDRHRHHATVWLAPGEPPRVTSDRAATNHQGVVDWPEYARWTRTVERLDHLEELLKHDDAGVIGGMLEPPMRSTDYEGGFGTLYTAVYWPGAGAVEFHWPGTTWRHSFEAFREGTLIVGLGDAAAAATSA
jgi:predicted choloylglycine hydrolase